MNYVDKITFLGDLKIILMTVGTVLSHTGINAEGNATMEEFMGTENRE